MVSTLLVVVVVVVPSSSMSKSFSPLAILSSFFLSFFLSPFSFSPFLSFESPHSSSLKKEEIKDKVFKYSFSTEPVQEYTRLRCLLSDAQLHIQVPLGQYFKEFTISYQMYSTKLHSICSEEISQWPTFTCRLILTKPILLRSDCQPPYNVSARCLHHILKETHMGITALPSLSGPQIYSTLVLGL